MTEAATFIPWIWLFWDQDKTQEQEQQQQQQQQNNTSALFFIGFVHANYMCSRVFPPSLLRGFKKATIPVLTLGKEENTLSLLVAQVVHLYAVGGAKLLHSL